MTGFGDAARTQEGVSYSVELRCLNNRYFKANIRLPDALLSLEPELEAALRKRIPRGSVTLTVHFKDVSARAAHRINEAALRQYLTHLETVEKQAVSQMGSAGAVTLDIGSLLSLPGVVQPPDQTELLEQSRPTVHELLEEAWGKALQMRRREGEGLAEDLREQARFIAEQLQTVEERAPRVVEEYHERLQSRVGDLLARAELEVNQADLMREVAVFAERSDISEEQQRLKAHLEQFDQILAESGEDPAGRRLDFVTQEMLREANTIASKSNDEQISRTIVQIKGAIDRMKEQVQNVE